MEVRRELSDRRKFQLELADLRVDIRNILLTWKAFVRVSLKILKSNVAVAISEGF